MNLPSYKGRDTIFPMEYVPGRRFTIGKHLTGHSEESNIEGVVLKNILARDGVVKSLDETNIIKNEFVGEIKIIN